ncbi:hypothetical protein [Clostridium sp. C8-1-8]|nr:hypothetical protein [Clostridium sp. C8-1-8]
MKSRNYTRNVKEEILREVQEVGNVSLVSRKHEYLNQQYLLG